MKTLTPLLALAAGASAAAAPACTFTISASGGQSGVLGQLADGQNRIGGGHPTGRYSLSSVAGGAITDAQGRGCILTPPTSQFQCDVGAQPTTGFSLAAGSGLVLHDGSSTFYACPATDSEYNVYTTPVPNQLKCVAVQLTASGCYDSTTTGPAPSSGFPVSSYWKNATSTSTVTVPVVSTSSTTVKVAPPPPPPTTTTTTTKQSTPPPPPPPQSTVYITHVISSTVQTVTVTAVPVGCVAPTGPLVIVSQISDQQGQAPTGGAPPPPPPPPATSTTVTVAPPPQTTSTTIVVPVSPVSPVSHVTITTSTTVVTSSHAPHGGGNGTSTSTGGAQPTGSGSGKACPGYLPAAYEYPHLIVPVSRSAPNTTFGTSYNGKVTPDVSSIFNFDVPGSYAGASCSLVFLFPQQAQLETSAYTFTGDGAIDFAQLANVATVQTSYTSVPAVRSEYGVKSIVPGSATTVATFACPAGQAISVRAAAVSGTSLDFFQDYNPCPIGLYLYKS